MKRNTKYLLVLIVILMIIVLLTNGVTYAKYVSNSVLNYYLNSKGFYFESDSLTIDGSKEIVDTAWDGENVYFTLKNSSNDVLATDFDIRYTVVCEVKDVSTTKVCKINGTNLNSVEAVLSSVQSCSNYSDDKVDVSSFDEDMCKEKNYVWESKPTFSNIYFNVVDTSGNEVDAASVVITAKAISPYEKTLSAKYILTKDENDIGKLSLLYEDDDLYNSLIVSNSYSEDKCLNLKWNSDDLILDTSDSVYEKYSIDTNYYINEITFKLSKFDSIKYRFYKKDSSKSYSEADFNLVESSECQ